MQQPILLSPSSSLCVLYLAVFLFVELVTDEHRDKVWRGERSAIGEPAVEIGKGLATAFSGNQSIDLRCDIIDQ